MTEHASIPGRPLASAEVASVTAWRSYIDPIAGIQRLSDFARWFFTSATIVGALAAGLTFTGGFPTDSRGRTAFAFALMLVGAALACSTLSLAPTIRNVDPYDADDVLQSFRQSINWRARWLRAATVLFSSAFILAGVVQYASIPAPQVPHARRPRSETATYTLTDRGQIKVTYTSVGLPRASLIELTLVPDSALLARDTVSVAPRALVTSSRSGGTDSTDPTPDSAAVELAFSAARRERGEVLLLRRWVSPAHIVSDSTGVASRLDTLLRIPISRAIP